MDEFAELDLLPEVSDDELLASICEESFFEFFLEFWETIEAVELVPNWHIKYLCDELQDVYNVWARKENQADVLINVPPGTSKSTTVTQLFPAWLWLKNSGIRILSSSHTAPLAISHSVKSRQCLKSPKFQRLWPGLIEFQDDQDGKTDYRNKGLGQRFSTSTGTGGAMGNHADFIIIDDPINPQAGQSEAGRAAAEDHLKTLATRKTDKARTVTILVMQRIHESDPAGIWLKSGKALRHICLPGELPSDPEKARAMVKPVALIDRYTEGLLDSRRLGRVVLAGLKITLGSYGYAGQVMQIPAPDEGGMLKKAWFHIKTWEEFQQVPGAKHATWHADADTAYTANQQNDPTAVLLSCYLGQTLYVRHVSEHWLELPQLKKKLPEVVAANGFTSTSKLHVEPKASGISVMQELRAGTQLNVVAAPTPGADKITRVNTASPFIEAGRVVLVQAPGLPWNVEAFISQASTFPNAAHDDMLDCLTQAIDRYNNKSDDWGVAC
jgi:predicted phage terminase large subunit-like protein